LDAAMFGRGAPMFGGPAEVTSPAWPQPSPFTTDIAKARRLLAEAGLSDGFQTTLSFDLGVAVTNEPICELIQESLGQLGIKVTLNKVPGASWRGELAKKSMPMLVNIFGGIVRCDIIAEGVINAVKKVGVRVPVVVRLEGTNAEAARALLAKSGLTITAAADLTDAARKVVALAGKKK